MSKKNGKPLFNFRKMSFNQDIQLDRLRMHIMRQTKKLDNDLDDETFEALVDDIENKNRDVIRIISGVVEYLPDEYLIEGKTSDDVDFDDPDSIMNHACTGAFDRLTVDLAQAKQDYVKKSAMPSRSGPSNPAS
jgi:hypothetical protein